MPVAEGIAMAYSISAQADARDRRGARRAPCALAVEVREARRFAVPAEVSDLAPRGARISQAGPFTPGAAMAVLLPDGEERAAQVVWSHDGESGVRFSAPLDARNHATLLRGRSHLKLIAPH